MSLMADKQCLAAPKAGSNDSGRCQDLQKQDPLPSHVNPQRSGLGMESRFQSPSVKAGVCVSISLTADLAAFCCHVDVVLNSCYAILGCETFSPAPLETVLS